ncbi:FBP domain-containing protein [Tsukamurella sp. 8F]|uniref:FBP domain-containing protein n=1 Tax=unclassified Tsukamurella TaxID=2633480 RepID=UPI0023B8FE84|nr:MULTISPECIES: FBP domain-containing protein [unclassified Tsukamurella]MDF0531991.1 FBP domain-containing protein [Tsukamurella sp. 8J]MDF0588890.1 FBP domain-containing protein [Tsukamurella sp. 8F]
MQPVTEAQIRGSFINCSKGDAKRLSVPKDLAGRPWEDLDFLGWEDPTLAARCYIVVPEGDALVGVALRAERGTRRTQMCALCLTTHTGGGVGLLTGKKAGESGRKGDTVGTYICADLQCSLYVRGKKTPALGSRYREDLAEEEKIARLGGNLTAFLARVRGV